MNTLKRFIYLMHSTWLLQKIRRSKHAATRQIAQQRLTQLLGSKRGIGMKIGQAMAGMDDQSHFTELTQSVKAWPLEDIVPVLEHAWQQPVESVLEFIEESVAAASLGQVHKGTRNTDSGTPEHLAIKVQYPDIRQAIESELSLAALLPKAGPVKRWDFDLNSYQQTLQNTLNDELDYSHEMKQQQRFQQHIHVAGLKVAEVCPELSSAQVLTQQWMDGQRLSEACNWPDQARLKAGKTLMQTLWKSLFEIGLVHGDPHPGNLLFQYDEEQPQVCLLDFGCMLNIPFTRRMSLLNLILGLRGKTTLKSFDAFIGLGFDAQKLEPIKAELDALAKILFRPFLQQEPFDTAQWQLSKQVNDLLGDQRWQFRSASPADLFLILRTFQGLVHQLESLKIQLSWPDMLDVSVGEQYIETALLWKFPKTAHEPAPTYKGSAKSLHVHITRDGRSPMKIEMSAASALDLHNLIPEHLLPQIKAANIDMLAIEQELHESGLEPQTLLDITLDDKHFHLWLE
ncbi:MAG: AarF/UbiB family protein [Mariprofundus sp.]|nr:AarF/UbiB family protein [Mariprofundus sp.]